MSEINEYREESIVQPINLKTKAQKKVICLKCGYKMEEEDSFCGNCGSKLK